MTESGRGWSFKALIERPLRDARTRWRNRVPARRLEALRDSHEGETAFIVASGPTLAGQDLRLLEAGFVCTVNMSLRIADDAGVSVAMHVINDLNRFRRFRHEILDISGRHRIPYRFYHLHARRLIAPSERDQCQYFTVNRGPMAFGSRVEPLEGLSGSATVVIFAAQLLHLMGFETVYILGCDLDYGGTTPYYYSLNERDRVHEADAGVQARRISTEDANAQFALLRTFFERTGRRLVNAGLGGRLEALPRMSLLEAATEAHERRV